MSVIPVVVATMLGVFLGGFEAAAAAAVGLAVGGLGAAVVMGRRMWGVAEVAFVEWEVELAGDMARMRLAETEAEEDEAWEADVAEWQAAAAARFERQWEAARRRWWAERVRGRGG